MPAYTITGLEKSGKALFSIDAYGLPELYDIRNIRAALAMQFTHATCSNKCSTGAAVRYPCLRTCEHGPAHNGRGRE